MSAEEIAGAFMQHYYGTLDSNIAGLGPLYVSQFRAAFLWVASIDPTDWGCLDDPTNASHIDDWPCLSHPHRHSGTTRC